MTQNDAILVEKNIIKVENLLVKYCKELDCNKILLQSTPKYFQLILFKGSLNHYQYKSHYQDMELYIGHNLVKPDNNFNFLILEFPMDYDNNCVIFELLKGEIMMAKKGKTIDNNILALVPTDIPISK